MVEHLPDESKKELAKALKEVASEGSYLRRCLLCQLSGYGRYDPNAVRLAWTRFERAVAEVEAIGSDAVPPAGLFEREAGERR